MRFPLPYPSHQGRGIPGDRLRNEKNFASSRKKRGYAEAYGSVPPHWKSPGLRSRFTRLRRVAESHDSGTGWKTVIKDKEKT